MITPGSFSLSAAKILLLLAASSITTTAPAQSVQIAAETAPSTLPTFDVVSIKPNNSMGGNAQLNYTPDGIHISNVPIQALLHQAFGIEDSRIMGAPDWVKSSPYDIDAKVDDANVTALKKLTRPQRGQMLQALLEDRFKLKFHRETKDLPAYVLVVAKRGPKLTQSKPDGKDDTAKPRINMKSRGDIEALGTPMEIVVAVLSQQLGRTIVNQTGLSGSFDFTLHWVPAETVVHEANALDTSPPAAQLSDDAGPTIFTALEEQLGLRLESQKIPLETIVIDHIEMPSAN